MRQLAILFTALFVGLLGATAPTSFATPVYPLPPSEVVIDQASLSPGGAVRLTARGFCPGTTVTFSIGGVVAGSAVADSAGTATLNPTAPTTPGMYTVVAKSDAPAPCNITVTSQITVTGAAAPTGSNSSAPLVAGGIAVGVGACMVAVARIRRRQVSPAAA